jgi:hypothetical protein
VLSRVWKWSRIKQGVILLETQTKIKEATSFLLIYALADKQPVNKNCMKPIMNGKIVSILSLKEQNMALSILKTIIATIVASVVFLWLYHEIGYERSELLAFSLLIGLSCASLKSN